MKKIILIVAIGVASLATCFAQNPRFYAISVGIFTDPQPKDFGLLKRYGFMYAEPFSENQYTVYLGGFDDPKEANDLLGNIKPLYPAAKVAERKINPQNVVTVIQVATRKFNDEIKWDNYNQFDNYFAILNGDKIKIVTGIYPSTESAKNDLKSVRSKGFSDAFVKQVVFDLLIPLKEFETGKRKPLFPLDLQEGRAVAAKNTSPRPKSNDQRIKNPSSYQQTNPAPQGGFNNGSTMRPSNYATINPKTVDSNPSTSQPTQNTGNINDAIARYDNIGSDIGIRGIQEEPTTIENTSSLPQIRSKVKRSSAFELQKVLKSAGTYDGSLDGYYGPGTTAGYKKMIEQNKDLQKYELLAQYPDIQDPNAQSPLQRSIDNLAYDIAGSQVEINRSNEAVALGYKAYTLLNTVGASNEVNLYMNQAIKQAYANATGLQRAPIDYNATYAYNDNNQLVLHLLYIHAAPGNNYSAPCWLLERHSDIAALAQNNLAGIGNPSYRTQNCDLFMDWEEIRMMLAVANDMSGNQVVDPQQQSAAATLRSQLYMTTAPLTEANRQQYETWHQSLWSGLNGWSSIDPLHQRLVDAMKVTYFQSQVRLEDYYMDKGFSYQQSAGLAKATLKTLVGNSLARFY